MKKKIMGKHYRTLSDNRITTIPKEIVNLKNLKTL